MTQITVANVTVTTLEYNGVRVVTSKGLASFYGCEVINLQNNLAKNKSKFVEGKHYFKLNYSQAVDFAQTYLLDSSKVNNNGLTVWTERGAARHAKLLSTEKAWDVFEVLEDSYFKKAQPLLVPPSPLELAKQVVLLLENNEKLEAEKKAALLKIEKDAPKVSFAEAVTSMEGSCLVRDFAKVMGPGQNKLFSWLRDQKFLMVNNRPYQSYIDNGYFVVKEGTPYKDGIGKLQPCFTTRITGKGQVFLEKKMKEASYVC